MPPDSDFIEVFQDAADEWRWHRKAANGQIVETSGEGYVDRQYAETKARELNPGIELRDP